jgi:hypothetical protein
MTSDVQQTNRLHTVPLAYWFRTAVRVATVHGDVIGFEIYPEGENNRGIRA